MLTALFIWSGVHRDPAFEKSDGDLRTARAGAAG